MSANSMSSWMSASELSTASSTSLSLPPQVPSSRTPRILPWTSACSSRRRPSSMVFNSLYRVRALSAPAFCCSLFTITPLLRSRPCRATRLRLPTDMQMNCQYYTELESYGKCLGTQTSTADPSAAPMVQPPFLARFRVNHQPVPVCHQLLTRRIPRESTSCSKTDDRLDATVSRTVLFRGHFFVRFR